MGIVDYCYMKPEVQAKIGPVGTFRFLSLTVLTPGMTSCG
jgi:hypothetical protein